MSNIIRAGEVAIFSSASEREKAVMDEFCDVIEAYEEEYLCNCLGEEAYEKLIDDLIDYSAVDDWSQSEDYVDGELIKYHDVIYELSLGVGESYIRENPACLNQWDYADKFTTTCYEDLWVKGAMREVLAYLVYRESIPQLRGFNEGTEDAVRKMQIQQKYSGKMLERYVNRMSRWMNKVHEDGTCDFEGFGMIDCAEKKCDDAARRGRRRVIFRV